MPLDVLTPTTQGATQPMDDATKTILEQSFVELHKRTTHSGQRMQDAADNVAEQTRLGYLETKAQVGTREAAAMQRMDQDKLAGQILQQRSAQDQPQKA